MPTRLDPRGRTLRQVLTSAGGDTFTGRLPDPVPTGTTFAVAATQTAVAFGPQDHLLDGDVHLDGQLVVA